MLHSWIRNGAIVLFATIIALSFFSCASIEERGTARQSALTTLKNKIESASVVAIVPRIGIIANNSSSSSSNPVKFEDYKDIKFEYFTPDFRGFNPATGNLSDTPMLGEIVSNALVKGITNLFKSESKETKKDESTAVADKNIFKPYEQLINESAESLAAIIGSNAVVMMPGSEKYSELIIYVDLIGKYSISGIKDSKGNITLDISFDKSITTSFIDTKSEVALEPLDGIVKGSSTLWISANDSKRHLNQSVANFNNYWNFWLNDFYYPSSILFDSFITNAQAWHNELKSGIAVVK